MDAATALQLAADEQEERALRYRPVEILDYEPSDPSRGVLCPPGSVTVFLAPEGSKTLERVREAVRTGSGDVELARELRERFAGRERMSHYRGYRLLRRAPSFASLRYGGRTLGTNLFPPPGPDLLILENPYNGGRLRPEELTLVEHRRDDAESGLEAIALRHMPPLTEAERAVLERVPEDQLEMNLAVRAGCCDSITEIAQVVIAVTYAVMCMAPVDPGEEVEHLAEHRIEQLGPAVSARELLELRREALGHDH